MYSSCVHTFLLWPATCTWVFISIVLLCMPCVSFLACLFDAFLRLFILHIYVIFDTQSSFIGAMAIADLVKTTLGPKGMDKILQSVGRGQSVTVTNDGATILKSIYVDNPAAKVLIDISKVQDDEVGDGTTSVVVLAGELLREAEKLVQQKLHPMTIIAGFREASACARKVLEDCSMNNQADPEKFRRDLLNIAKTTLSSKILTQDKDFFSEIAVDAVREYDQHSDLVNVACVYTIVVRNKGYCMLSAQDHVQTYRFH